MYYVFDYKVMAEPSIENDLYGVAQHSTWYEGNYNTWASNNVNQWETYNDGIYRYGIILY